jgi:hypothetical protein
VGSSSSAANRPAGSVSSSPITEAFKAAIALLAIYGFQINDKQTALVIGLFAALSAAWHQSQVSPAPPQNAPVTMRGRPVA